MDLSQVLLKFESFGSSSITFSQVEEFLNWVQLKTLNRPKEMTLSPGGFTLETGYSCNTGLHQKGQHRSLYPSFMQGLV
jgi:hypothetical protein